MFVFSIYVCPQPFWFDNVASTPVYSVQSWDLLRSMALSKASTPSKPDDDQAVLIVPVSKAKATAARAAAVAEGGPLTVRIAHVLEAPATLELVESLQQQREGTPWASTAA